MNVSVQNPSVDGERSGPVPQLRQLGGDQFEMSPGNGSDLKTKADPSHAKSQREDTWPGSRRARPGEV
jgi:hypothetical protein